MTPSRHCLAKETSMMTIFGFLDTKKCLCSVSMQQFGTRACSQVALTLRLVSPYVALPLNRVISAFTTQIADLWLFDEQLQRWQAETLTPEQQAEVARLVEQMRRLREVDHRVLALARELSKGTIEKVMAKSDEELGLEFLMGMFKEKP